MWAVKPNNERQKTPWRAPTRRAFVAMLGAAAAALAVRDHVRDPGDPRSTWQGTTRWVGHC